MDLKTQPYVVSNGVTAPSLEEPRTGWLTFAGIVMLVGAVANLFWGLAAFDRAAFLDETALLYGTLNTWGWLAIGWSALLLLGAIGLFFRAKWAPWVGIVLAAISCVFWVFALPALPIMAMTVMLIDVSVIYGLAVHGIE